jgi:hypothetical protein
MRKPILAAVVIAAAWMPLAGRANDTPLETAALAWDRGDYIPALTTYLKVLEGSPTNQEIEAIALQTGELFHTTELTTDGSAPAFSSDGRYFTYEKANLSGRTIRLSATDQPAKPLADLTGYNAVFSPDSAKLAYLRVAWAPAIAKAAAAIDEGPAEGRTPRIVACNAEGPDILRLSCRCQRVADLSGNAWRGPDRADHGRRTEDDWRGRPKRRCHHVQHPNRRRWPRRTRGWSRGTIVSPPHGGRRKDHRDQRIVRSVLGRRVRSRLHRPRPGIEQADGGVGG